MKRNGATAIVLVALMTVAFTGMASAVSDNSSPNAGGNGAGGENGNGDRPDDPGTFGLNQTIVFGEKVVYDGTDYGIFVDGSLLGVSEVDETVYYNYNPDDPTELWWSGPMYSRDVNVVADWSDNLVLHEWKAGGKIRTEVILLDVSDMDATVFTIRAAFAIEYFNVVSQEYEEIWTGKTQNGLWVDQQAIDYYSAEVNQVGNLLYGYNWDTDGLNPGTYRLTFSIGALEYPTYPGADEGDPAAGSPISTNAVTITGMVDPGMYGPEAPEPSENYSLLDYDWNGSMTSIVIELL